MKILFLFVLISSCAAILALISNLINSGDINDIDLDVKYHRENSSIGKDLKNIFWFVQVLSLSDAIFCADE